MEPKLPNRSFAFNADIGGIPVTVCDCGVMLFQSEMAWNHINRCPSVAKDVKLSPIEDDFVLKKCWCGNPEAVSPDGYTSRHRQDDPCYVQKHDASFLGVWEAIKGWDIQRRPGQGYAGATGDDVCEILESIARHG